MQALRTFETILQFRQGDVRLAANLLPEPLMHGRSDSVRSSSPPPWSVDLAGLSSPCRNLLGPTHTDPELLRDFLQRPFAGVISLKELSPQIIRVSLWHRDRAENRHPAAYLRPPVYEFTEKALVSAESMAELKRVYTNYFLDVRKFTKIVEDAIGYKAPQPRPRPRAAVQLLLPFPDRGIIRLVP